MPCLGAGSPTLLASGQASSWSRVKPKVGKGTPSDSGGCAMAASPKSVALTAAVPVSYELKELEDLADIKYPFRKARALRRGCTHGCHSRL